MIQVIRALGASSTTMCAIGLVATASLGPFAPSSAAADATPTELQEVIVTARRRQENAQSVPIAITAVSQKALDENNVKTFSDLQYLVPSMDVTNASRDEQYVSIRGISGLATDGQGVISYLNEVPLPSGPNGGTGGGGPGLFYDLENVQVLKGPQGTLFGRNTIGGAVLFQSRRPGNEFGGYVEATLGNHRDREINGAVDLPLVSDQLFARIAFNGDDRAGYTTFQSTGNHAGSQDLDNRHFFAGRVTLSYRPTTTLQNDFIFDSVDNTNHGTSSILSYVDPNGVSAFFFPSLPATLLQQQSLGIRNGVALDSPTYADDRFRSYTDIFRVDLSDHVTFRNIINSSKFSSTSSIDYDGTDLPLAGAVVDGHDTPDLANVVQTYSEEPQFLGKAFDGKTEWTAGAFYLNQPTQPYTVVASNFLGIPAITEARQANRSKALYLQATQDLSSWVSGLKLTAGYRYTWDTRFQQSRSLDGNGACTAPAPPADSTCTQTGQTDSHAPNWTLGLDYQLTPETLLYVVGRKGYHTGGINLTAIDASNQFYRPEFITDQEVGLKSDWTIAGLRGRTNVDVYHQNYTSIQTIHDVLDNAQIIGVFGNAAAAQSWGTEFEGILYLTERLELGVQYAWLNFRYTDFGAGVDPLPLQQLILLNRPRNRYGVNAHYHLPIPEQFGDISIDARWSWQSRTVTTPSIFEPATPQIDPLSNQPGYGLLNLGMHWDQLGGHPLGASFFMTNALNKNYTVLSLPLSSLLGFGTVTYGEPRMFGFRLRYNFGAAQ